MKEGTLYASSNRGRYQIDYDKNTPELTSGQVIEVYINGQWIEGRVEHARLYRMEAVPEKTLSGYYVTFPDGSTCGLCLTMKVRVQQ